MAVQDYQASVQPEALPGRPYPRFPDEQSPASTGAAIGRGVEEAGDVAQRAYMQAVQSQVTDAHNQLQVLSTKLTHDPNTGAFAQQGQNAFDLQNKYLPQFDTGAQQIIQGMPPGAAQRHAAQAAAQLRTELESQLDSHELQAHKQFAVETAKSSIALSAQRAAENNNHPDIVANALETSDISANRFADSSGMGPEQREEFLYRTHADFHKGVLDRMLSDGETQRASVYLDQVRDQLKGPELKEAQKAIKAGQIKDTADQIMAGYQTDVRLGEQRVTDLPKSGLSQDDQFAVIRQIDQQRRELEAMRRQDPQVQQTLTALEEGVARRQISPNALGTVDDLWHRGAISDEQRISLRSRIDGINSAAQDDQDNREFFRTHYAQRIPLDPESDSNKKGVDALFGDLTQNAKQGTAEWANRAVDVTDRVGMVPPSVLGYVRASLTSGEPQVAGQAADLMQRLEETNPRALDFTDKRTRTMALQISEANKAGADLEGAVETARKISEMPEGQVKVLNEQYKQLKAEEKNPGKLAAALKGDDSFKPHRWSSLPPVPLPMQSAYDSLTHEYYLRTGGNLQQARALAINDLKRVWGVSEVNGKREIMPYAPEAMFPGLKAEDVRDDIAKTVSDNNLKIDPATVRLQEDPQRTARTQGSQWNLVAPDKNGLLDAVRDERGKPLVYQIPVTRGDFADVQYRKQAHDMMAAGRLQEEHRKVEEYQKNQSAPLIYPVGN